MKGQAGSFLALNKLLLFAVFKTSVQVYFIKPVFLLVCDSGSEFTVAIHCTEQLKFVAISVIRTYLDPLWYAVLLKN